MGHDEFQGQVIAGIARLETKMNLLVGPDGNNGKISVIEDRLDKLESEQDKSQGRYQGKHSWLYAALSSIGGSAATIALQKMFGH